MPFGIGNLPNIWRYLRHPFLVLEDAVPALEQSPDEMRDPERLKRTYRSLLTTGRTFLGVRAVVMVLLYFSIVASTVSGIVRMLGVPEVEQVVSRILAVSTAFGALLLLLFLLLNRLIGNVQNHVLVVALELSRALDHAEEG